MSEEKRAALRLAANQRFSDIEQPARATWLTLDKVAKDKYEARVGGARLKRDEIIKAADAAWAAIDQPAAADRDAIALPAREEYETIVHPARDAFYAECKAIDSGERD